MLHWSIFLAGVAFTAIASTQASIIEKWENTDLEQGIAEQDHKNVKFAGGYSSEFGVGTGQDQTCHCGFFNDDIRDAGRIINGKEVQQESKYPFLVNLRLARTGQHWCGGSIITPLHILTAAHCYSHPIERNPPDVHKLIPIVGLHRLSQEGSLRQTQELKVREVFIPVEWYDSKIDDYDWDLAVLVLEAPIQFSKLVSPVCLSPVMPPITNTNFKVIGWGKTETGQVSETLKETDLLALGQHCPHNPREVCFQADGTSTCYGDSGGPFVYLDPETNRYTQVSLVSGGLTEECSGMEIGTNVVHYYDYIQKVVAGWGRTEKGDPETLMETNVLVMVKALCNNNPDEACFMADETSTYVCDSAGPFVHLDPETNRYIQVSLVSWGYDRCKGNFFIGTNVVHWYKWIHNIVARKFVSVEFTA